MLKEDFGFVVIDDFHVLDFDTKAKFADLMKVLADEANEKCKIVILGINKVGQPLINIAKDLSARMDIIKFGKNPTYKIQELIELGEQSLNIEINCKEDIVNNSEGSFQIAQILAHRACVLADVKNHQTTAKKVTTSFLTIKEQIIDELALSFYELAKKFSTGQRIKKGSRAPYLHVLNWLSKEPEWSLNIRSCLARNPDHKPSVGQIIDRGHLRDHLDANSDLKDIVYYDDSSTILSIEDPKFFFYIKNISWSNFALNIGFPSIEFEFKYDYALSFAGSQRSVAEKIFKKLEENEIAVFYDFNEQHRILAEDVEEYLAPIYSSESRFVVALLSKEYPQKIWCKFEGEQFRKRFGEKSVIPIWFKDNYPGFFDPTSGIGGMSFDEAEDLDQQVNLICSQLIEKIQELRIQENVDK